MSRREDFDNAIWSDPDFLALSPQARWVFIWTWTNPRCGMAGIYKTAAVQAAMETGLTEAEVKSALVELGDAEFAFYEGNVLWVRSRVKHLRQKTPQIAKSIRNDLAKIADGHPLKAQFMATYKGHSWLRDYIGTEAHVTLSRPIVDAPQSPDRESDGHSTVLGTGTGKGTGFRGRGAGKGKRSAPPSETYSDDPRMAAIRDAHFPTHSVASIQGAVATLRIRHRQEPSVDAIREFIGDVPDYPVSA